MAEKDGLSNHGPQNGGQGREKSLERFWNGQEGQLGATLRKEPLVSVEKKGAEKKEKLV